jgi:hypothetical protein
MLLVVTQETAMTTIATDSLAEVDSATFTAALLKPALESTPLTRTRASRRRIRTGHHRTDAGGL